jgi:hypothetical protein
MPSLVGVFREPEYSPGRVDDDAAILERTREALAARGVTMTLGDVDLVTREQPTAVLAMCQSPRALAALDGAAATVPVINSPDAIRACYRDATVARLTNTAVPFPATRVIMTTSRPGDLADLAPCWVKRGDVHAMVSDDVVFAATAGDVAAALDQFVRRGIAQAALQAHVDGVVIKFYGVADGRFFRCYTAGAEIPAPLPVLWAAAHAGASALGLEVFGGDLVVTAEGKPVLVDLNDWPSFARCRDEAADAIAGYVVDRLAAAWPCTQGQHG